jgi:flagellar export protein FliJ
MNTKRRKLKRVIDLREEALAKRAQELKQSKLYLEDARDAHSRESERLLVAEKRRAELTNGPVEVSSWIDAEQWLMQKKSDLGRANGRVAEAETTVQLAWHSVVEARIDKKRVELLDERLSTGEIRRENRLEQRLLDELAQRVKKCDED